MSEPVVVRSLGASEVDRYRDLRLRSLLDSPEAFTATWQEESNMPEADWSRRVEDSLIGRSALAVADAGDDLVGLAVGIAWGDRARVVGVWVAPDWRNHGLAQRLIEKVCEWAVETGYSEVQIETTLGNPGPQRLYERLGFVRSDEASPPELGPVLVRHL